MKKIYHILFLVAILGLLCNNLNAQEKDYSKMTKEEVMQMTYDQLLELPLEDLMVLANIVGVSADELLQMVLNQDVKSASKKVEKNFESPLSTSVVTYDEIKASGATTVEEALRLLPGVIIREKTNGNYDVHLRGNDNLPSKHMFLYTENTMTLVMIDGRPVYNYAHGGTLWESLPVGIEDIERIEVVRGPSSALYGPNAVSGVINVITKNVESKDFHVNTDLQAGTMNTRLGSISASKGFGKFKMRFSGNYEFRDRDTDKLYAYADSSYHTLEDAYENLETPQGNKVFDPKDDMNETYPNPGVAKDRLGLNGFFYYGINENFGFDMALGTQMSEIISSTLGDAPTPLSTRESQTSYVDFRSNIYGFKPQINYSTGIQDFVKGDEGFKMDISFLNVNLEYDYNFKNLNIRPGVFYQQAKYEDTDHLDSLGNGFLNGKATVEATAASLRLDYIAFNKLRFIAAIRGEQYNNPDDMYLSYQFGASYSLNDNHLFRFVHSKANRGPFVADTYTNYFWDRVGRDSPRYIYFKGNTDLDLLTMSSVEIGYRVKPVKNILIDLEIFQNKTNDFGALMPDSVTIFSDLTQLPLPTPYARLTYQNLDLEAVQTGVTANISYVPRENLALRLYGTYQQTDLKNVYPLSHEEAMMQMFDDAIMNGLVDLNGDGAPEDFNGDGIPDPYPNYFIDLNGDGIPEDLNQDGQIDENDYVPTAPWSTQMPNTLVSEMEHEATPSYYGGFSINYLPFKKKVNLYANVYMYGEHTMKVKNLQETIEAKFITNLKVSYNFYKNHWVYLNARNLLSDDKREFMYGDYTNGIYMLGLSLVF